MAKNSFEERLKQLEAAVEKLESGDLSLEESLEVYEMGMKRVLECRESLQKAEQKVLKLQEDAEGNLISTPFDTPEEN